MLICPVRYSDASDPTRVMNCALLFLIYVHERHESRKSPTSRLLPKHHRVATIPPYQHSVLIPLRCQNVLPSFFQHPHPKKEITSFLLFPCRSDKLRALKVSGGFPCLGQPEEKGHFSGNELKLPGGQWSSGRYIRNAQTRWLTDC